MQSRGTLICFISTILILIIFNNNLSHFKKVLLILVLISIPSSIAELISNYKFNYNLHNFYNKCILKIDNNYKKESICDTTNYTYSLNYEFVENYFKKKKKLLIIIKILIIITIIYLPTLKLIQIQR